MRLLILILAFLFLPLAAQAEQAKPIRVAVLPFTTPKDQPALALYGPGTMDSLIQGLKHVPRFSVVDRSQIDHVIRTRAAGVDGDKAAQEVGKIVGAEVLVSGSVQSSGNQVRIAASFTDARSAAITESHQVTGTLAQIGALQNELVDRFANNQKVALTPEQQQRIAAVLKATGDATAYESYLKGRAAFLLYTPRGFQEAASWYQKAIAADPRYALAYAGLAETFTFWGYLKQQSSVSAQAEYQQAFDASKQAIQINAGLPEAYRAFAWASQYLGKPGFELAMRKALSLNANDAETWYGYWVASGNGADPDHEYIKKALALDPDLVGARLDRGNALFDKRRFQDASAEYRHAIQVSPGYAPAHNNLGTALAAMKQYGEAVAAYQEALRIDPDYAVAHENLAKSLALQGKKVEAVKEFQTYLRLRPDAPDAAQVRAAIEKLSK